MDFVLFVSSILSTTYLFTYLIQLKSPTVIYKTGGTFTYFKSLYMYYISLNSLTSTDGSCFRNEEFPPMLTNFKGKTLFNNRNKVCRQFVWTYFTTYVKLNILEGISV